MTDKLIMVLIETPTPMNRGSGLSLSRLLVGLCLVVALAVGLTYAATSWLLGTPKAPTYDYDFTGDPAAIQNLNVPVGFQKASDLPGCVAATYARCFVTAADRSAALAYLHSTVGAAADGSRETKAGWSACGSLDGTPAIGFIRKSISNAINTGPGSWRIPRSGPIYDGQLTVGIMLVNSPNCVE